MKHKGIIAGLAAGLMLLQSAAALSPAYVQAADLERKTGKEEASIVLASSTKELFEAFKDNTTIVLKPGVYNITEYIDSLKEPSYWGDYEVKMGQGVYVSQVFDGEELIINDYENVVLASSDKKNPAEIVIEPRYADVLSFTDCENILIEGLLIGHTKEQGSCVGDVISLDSCEEITIADCELYGCGTYALTLDDCEDVTAMDCDVHDCTYGCVIGDGENTCFIHCDFHDCVGYTMFELNGGSADFIGCDFRNLDGNFLSNEGCEVSFTACTYDDNVKMVMPGSAHIRESSQAGEEKEETEEKPSKGKDDKASETKAEETKPSETKTEETKKKDDKSSKQGLISFTATETPVEIKDRETELVYGNYWEITLDEDSAKACPELDKALKKINEEEKKNVLEMVADMEEDALYMNEASSYGMEFEHSKSFSPARADDKAFSYSYWVYEYSGGVHGFSYPLVKNIDPVTGEDIPLSAVVKDTTELPGIMVDELLKQNEDLVEYFGEEYGESQLNTLRDENKNRVKNDGEMLCWALGYDGIYIFYEDYAMGSYVAGIQEEIIRFEDYPEIFTDTYIPEENSKTPDIAKQAEIKQEKTITIESKEHPVHTIPLGYEYKEFAPDDLYMNDYGFYTYVEEFVAEDQVAYPKLKKALESFNSDNEKDAEISREDLEPDAKEAYEAMASKKFTLFSAGYHLSLRRADDNFVSFMTYIDNDATTFKPVRLPFGKNLYTDTGEDIELLDIVTDADDLIVAAGDKLKKIFYDEEIRAAVLYELTKQLKGEGNKKPESTVSSEELAWCLGYNGLDIYLSDNVNYNFYGDTEGPVRLFIPFKEYPDLFVDKVKDIPGAYVYDLEVGTYPEKLYMDMDVDGKIDEVSVKLLKNEDDWYYSFLIEYGDKSFEFTDGVGGYEAAAYVVSTYDGESFLYLCQQSEDGYEYISVYALNETPSYTGRHDGNVRFVPWGDNKKGSVMTTVKDFKIGGVDGQMGSLYAVGSYQVGWNGIPGIKDVYMDYEPVDWDITTKKDISAQVIDEDYSILEQKATLKKGTKIIPLKRNDWGGFIVKTDDGTIYRIQFTKDEEGTFVLDGKYVWELFDGLAFAG